eukprot:NODE_115_length_19014_cov_0.489664.p2 type:complete len:630 gc:universal NODE_115_length_19014_cov_0.489664:10587-8698(-)
MSESENAIKIYARVRPSKQPLPNMEIEDNMIQIKITKSEQGLVNHQKELHKFKFDSIFDDKTSQANVFETVALSTIKHVLLGYHGTLFVYGQTGTGKTYTMTGGDDNYHQRGVMPRTLEYIFNDISTRRGYRYDVGVSYLEIYNEFGYDLLDENREATKLEELPRVSIMEDDAGSFHLRNLAIMPCHSVEDAMNLLFLGDTNKMMAETPSNPQSSRSHCVFTIHVTRFEVGSLKVCKSQLHLVDLAGSERVSKTGIDGRLLREAKHINLSLHYLEQVIISLQSSKKKHIPYRNSMLTCILREALGGNCKTTMIATVANESGCLEEGVSTFRFAQRVALISNNAHINEEIDPQSMIKLLKEEIGMLKLQIGLLSGDQAEQELESHDFEKLDILIDEFVNDRVRAQELLTVDSRKLLFVMNKLKSKITCRPSTVCVREDSGKSLDVNGSSSKEQELQNTISQRDQEIKVLLDLNKNHSKQPAGPSKEVESFRSMEKKHRDDLFVEFKKDNERLKWTESFKKKYNEMVTSAQLLSQNANQLKNAINAHPSHSSPECLGMIKKYKDTHELILQKKRALDHHKHLLEKSASQLKADFNAFLVQKSTAKHVDQAATSDAYGEYKRLKEDFQHAHE